VRQRDRTLRAGSRRVSAPGLVIFDCDGVLVDSEGISMRELTRSLTAAGATLTEDAVRDEFVGISLADIEAKAGEHVGGPLPDGWLERFLAARAAAFERELQPVRGAAQAIEAVRALGWETCVASGGRLEKMAQTLRLTGLDGCFPAERIFSATMVARGKPAPDVFLHAAQACGFEPSACVVVEDSAPGVIGALAAGMRTLAYVDGDAALAARLTTRGAEPIGDLRDLPTRLVG
jgi:HAD superfamily hydrolase (TIGR01509 family)